MSHEPDVPGFLILPAARANPPAPGGRLGENDVTRFLAGLTAGGRDALDRLFPLLYEELHGLAQRQLRSERAD
ncbi:MAG: ECF-type sigma factor, partial [Longimicrobiales bacterium]